MKNEADVLAAARTLERMRAYLSASVPPPHRAAIFSELSRIAVEELATMNPVEAEHVVESVARRVMPMQNPSVPQGPSMPRDDAATESAVVCASRASALAMTQTRAVASRLALAGVPTTILTVTTTGDRVQDRPLVAIGSQSLFVKELEAALRDGRAAYAVHSCKDLPSDLPEDMEIAAISEREDPRDAFCSERYASFDALPAGAKVGTSSMRRRAQLASLRPDLDYADVRGNVDTRLRKLREGGYDAIVLACAGLRRLNVGAAHTVPFDLERIVPATGQGALAVETRANSPLTPTLYSAVNHEPTERAVSCERAALRALRGGCQAPIGIHARFEGDDLVVTGVVASPDGSTALSETLRAHSPDRAQCEALGTALADELLKRGAERLLALPKNLGT